MIKTLQGFVSHYIVALGKYTKGITQGMNHILIMDIVKFLDGALSISKRCFFKDVENSFHEVTHIGLEPH